MPAKIVAEITDIMRLWTAGMGPRGTGRPRRRRRARSRWRKEESARYTAIEVKRNDHVEPHDWVWLHRNPTIAGCSDR